VKALAAREALAWVGDNSLVRVALLGPFEIQNDTGDCLPVAGTRLRDLIARLALAGGRPVNTSALAEAVWGMTRRRT
jgi:DNA-binding SARP family transcriptional activator